MDVIVYLLVSLLLMAAIVKMSFWRWWMRVAYALVLAVFVVWSERYAILQSKTMLLDLLQDKAFLQDLAVLITIEAVFFMRRAYPPLLLFPAMFYVLTQMIFAFPGVPFMRTTVGLALALLIGMPLLAVAVRRGLSDATFRREIMLVLTIIVCLVTLFTTQNGVLTWY